jgi:hypothetical protein
MKNPPSCSPMGFGIRRAKAGEEERIVEMYEWLFAPPGSKPWQWDPDKARPRLSEALRAPRSAILVAEHRGALIAFCTAYLELDSVRFGQRCLGRGLRGRSAASLRGGWCGLTERSQGVGAESWRDAPGTRFRARARRRASFLRARGWDAPVLHLRLGALTTQATKRGASSPLHLVAEGAGVQRLVLLLLSTCSSAGAILAGSCFGCAACISRSGPAHPRSRCDWDETWRSAPLCGHSSHHPCSRDGSKRLCNSLRGKRAPCRRVGRPHTSKPLARFSEQNFSPALVEGEVAEHLDVLVLQRREVRWRFCLPVDTRAYPNSARTYRRSRTYGQTGTAFRHQPPGRAGSRACGGGEGVRERVPVPRMWNAARPTREKPAFRAMRGAQHSPRDARR